MIQSPRNTAFTLVELLTVITIIAILAGLILSTSGYIQKKGAISRAQAEIAAMEAALESYRADNGIYPIPPNVSTANPPTPTDADGLSNNLALRNALFPTATNQKVYMEFKPNQLNSSNQIIDPWGTPYRYNAPGRYNTATFDLWSTGGVPSNRVGLAYTSSGASDGTQQKTDYLNLITNWGSR